MKPAVLYVDDEQANLDLFRRSFDEEFRIVTASTGHAALAQLETEQVGVLATDQRMAPMTAIELLTEAAARWPDVARMLLTAYADRDLLLQAINLGKVQDYVLKPWRTDELGLRLRAGLDAYEHKRALILNLACLWVVPYAVMVAVPLPLRAVVMAAWPLLLVWSLRAEMPAWERHHPWPWSVWWYPSVLGLSAIALDRGLWPDPMLAGGSFPHICLIHGGLALALPALFVLLARARRWNLRIEELPLQHWVTGVMAILLVLPPYMGFAKGGQLVLLVLASGAVWRHELPKLEQRWQARRWWVRVTALAVAGVGFAAGQVLIGWVFTGTAPPRNPMDLSRRSLFLACAWPITLGLSLAIVVSCSSAADGVAWALRHSTSVRGRMLALGLLCAGLAFALSGVPLELLFYREVKVALRPMLQLTFLTVIVWSLSAALAYGLSRSLEQSVNAMAQIRRGNLAVALDDSGRDEVAAVARNFNQMVARLREAEFLEQINVDLRSRSSRLTQTLDALQAAQAELVRSERMASVATLVKGIAHELNNPINYIAGNMAPLQRYGTFLTRVAGELSDGRARNPQELHALTTLAGSKDLRFVSEDLARLTADIAEGARRAQLIILDLQNLTSVTQRGVEELDLHGVVRQTVALLAPRVPAGVRLETELEPVVTIPAYAGQIEQVLVNLTDNALRAVGEKGRVTIYAGRDGGEAVVRVSDDGPGMTPDVERQAFEPFFTTRRAGEGSGLGLAIVATIVRGHRGTVKCSSAPGRGTDVEVRLPLEAELVHRR